MPCNLIQSKHYKTKNLIEHIATINSKKSINKKYLIKKLWRPSCRKKDLFDYNKHKKNETKKFTPGAELLFFRKPPF